MEAELLETGELQERGGRDEGEPAGEVAPSAGCQRLSPGITELGASDW